MNVTEKISKNICLTAATVSILQVLANHDEYTKPPVYNFEFHTRLFQYTFSEKFAEYYNNVKTKLIKDEGSEYGISILEMRTSTFT